MLYPSVHYWQSPQTVLWNRYYVFILFDYYVSWEECGADRCVCYKLQSVFFDQFTVKLNPLSGFQTITKTLGKIFAWTKNIWIKNLLWIDSKWWTQKKKKFLCHYLDNFEIYGFHNLFLKNLNNSITSAMNFFTLQKSSQFSFL